MNETFQKWTSTKKNYIATAEAHVKIISNGKKRVFQKKVGQSWTNLKKIIIQPVKNKLFKHYECHQKTNTIN